MAPGNGLSRSGGRAGGDVLRKRYKEVQRTFEVEITGTEYAVNFTAWCLHLVVATFYATKGVHKTSMSHPIECACKYCMGESEDRQIDNLIDQARGK